MGGAETVSRRKEEVSAVGDNESTTSLQGDWIRLEVAGWLRIDNP